MKLNFNDIKFPGINYSCFPRCPSYLQSLCTKLKQIDVNALISKALTGGWKSPVAIIGSGLVAMTLYKMGTSYLSQIQHSAVTFNYRLDGPPVTKDL